MALVALCLLLALGSAAASAEKPLALVPDEMLEALRGELNTSWKFSGVDNASASALKEAAVLVPSFALIRDQPHFLALLPQLPHGALLQIAMTGYDWLKNLSDVPARYTICNVHNSDVAIPEYVLAAILSWNVRLPQMDADFRRCTWQATASNDCARPTVHTSTKGQTIGIVGYGHLGSGVAVRAAALGMRVVAVTHHPPPAPPAPLAWIGSDTDLPRLMQESDFVVVTLPLLPSTVGLISPSVLGHMKPTGVLINVARAPIVDEAGLYDALEQKRIGGAVLDVWWQSLRWMAPGSGPSAWPSKFNFSALPNVWMTPHISYDTEQGQQEGLAQVAANLHAFALGQPLSNVVRNGSTEALQKPSIVSI